MSSDKNTAQIADAAATAIKGASTVTITGNVSKNVTANATANSVTTNDKVLHGGTANATGIDATGAAEVTGVVSASISATATAKANNATATAVKGADEVTFSEGITAGVTATATATAGTTASTATATAIQATGALAIGGSSSNNKGLTGAINATATGNGTVVATDSTLTYYGGNAAAKGLSGSSSVAITGNVTNAINATANANGIQHAETKAWISGTALARGIETDTITITGNLSGAVTAKSTAKANVAEAEAICGSTSVALNGGVKGAITANATGDTARASGIEASADAGTLVIGTSSALADLAGAVNASATANGAYDVDIANSGSAKAWALRATGGITTYGNVMQNLSATTNVTNTLGGVSTAYGISAGTAAITITGDIKSTITASATTQSTSAATAVGIEGGAMTVTSNIGTLNVTATGTSANDRATGWYLTSITYTLASDEGPADPDDIVGKATVTCKTGTATGLKIAGGISFQYEDEGVKTKSGYAKLNITANGKDAIGIDFANTAATSYALEDSNITATTTDKNNGTAYAMKGADTVQTISLNKSTMTGNVDMGDGNDTLTLTKNSKITGNVDMGDGTADTLNLHSGTQIKGDVSNVDTAWLVIDDASSAGTSLWEGTSFGSTELGLDVKSNALSSLTTSGQSKTFSLLKDTDGNVWSESKAVTLKLQGVSESTTLIYQGTAVTFGDYNFQLTGDTNSTIMQLVVAKV